jgi:hypothetical protein
VSSNEDLPVIHRLKDIVLASTHDIPGKPSLSVDALESMVGQMGDASELTQEHGGPVIGRVLSPRTRRLPDGELELIGDVEINSRYSGTVDELMAKGISIGVAETGPIHSRMLAVISVDAAALTPEEMKELEGDLDAVFPVHVNGYYQFSDSPPFVVLIQLAQHALPSLLEMVKSGAWDVAKSILAEKLSRSKHPAEALDLRMSWPGHHLNLTVQSRSPKTIADALDRLPAAIRASMTTDASPDD